MNILLTNDDGISSPGLDALRKSLSKHDVWVVAPSTQQSGKSHSVTLYDPVRFTSIDKQVFSCDGTPADCVMYSYLGALPIKPDVVVSGINLGANLGTDLIYSGTAAAARQAALMGFPGIAISASSYTEPYYFEHAADFISLNIEMLISLWRDDHFININFPNTPYMPNDIRITEPSTRAYSDKLVRFNAPRSGTYYFIEGLGGDYYGDDSDSAAVADGAISVSPIFLHPQNKEEVQLYEKAEFRKSNA